MGSAAAAAAAATAAKEKERRCVVILGVSIFYIIYFSCFFSPGWQTMVMNENENAEEGEGGREKTYSYNIWSFASNAKVPVSNCVIALSYSRLSQQTWWGGGFAEGMWERANGRVCSWVVVRSCGCVSQKCVVCAYYRNINMCTLSAIETIIFT